MSVSDGTRRADPVERSEIHTLSSRSLCSAPSSTATKSERVRAALAFPLKASRTRFHSARPAPKYA